MNFSREPDHAARRRAAGAKARIASSKNVSSVGATLCVATETNEKAARQRNGLFFQGRIVPTESKKSHQNFLAKSYWSAKGSVKEFLENK
jgi:hypothetical protein